MSTFRLDKALSLSGERTRKESQKHIRLGHVQVNGVLQCNPTFKVNTSDCITLNSIPISLEQFFYFILNKPTGVITAASDSVHDTVMQLLPAQWANIGVRPVGRLDKDTTGLLLLTNDGTLAHKLLTPKKHIWKKYRATVTGQLNENSIACFKEGINFKDFTTLPAKLSILEVNDTTSVADVSITEGKFHQVKRMFHAIGNEVLTLERLSFGSLVLPNDLKRGKYRELTEQELATLKEII